MENKETTLYYKVSTIGLTIGLILMILNYVFLHNNNEFLSIISAVLFINGGLCGIKEKRYFLTMNFITALIVLQIQYNIF
jgi:hypothetical protein